MYAFLLSTGVIFVAELGDKSQLMAMTFATRVRARYVLAGITAATLLVHLGSVALGAAFGAVLPTTLVEALAGLAFLGFAAWTVRGDSLDEDEQTRAARAGRGAGAAVLAVGTAFFLAELGDKTMLATVTLATREDWLGTWLGSTVGMVAADALAIAAGVALGRHLPERVVRYGAAAAFAVFGLLLLLRAVT
jgi:putative Ca2+/H+ antiporter (TMEM165/GDT1 family)